MQDTFVPLNDDSGIKQHRRSSSHGSDSDLDLAHKGEGLEYRVHAKDEKSGKVVSLWHDISLVHIDPNSHKNTPYLNFVCEIPKFTRKKYEIATDEEGNPIKQDEKKGNLREVRRGSWRGSWATPDDRALQIFHDFSECLNTCRRYP